MVIFRAKKNCVVKEKTYDTTSGTLPPSFNDGTNSGGFFGNLDIMEKGPTNGTHMMEIVAKYINTTIVIRRFGLYLSVSVVTPDDVARAIPSYGHTSGDFHMELCSVGCPKVETITEYPKQVTVKNALMSIDHMPGVYASIYLVFSLIPMHL